MDHCLEYKMANRCFPCPFGQNYEPWSGVIRNLAPQRPAAVQRMCLLHIMRETWVWELMLKFHFFVSQYGMGENEKTWYEDENEDEDEDE